MNLPKQKKPRVTLKPSGRVKSIVVGSIAIWGGISLLPQRIVVEMGEVGNLLALSSYVLVITILLGTLWYRASRRNLQKRLNGEIASQDGELGDFILYLRPFAYSGKFKIPNNLESEADRQMMGPNWDFELALSIAIEPTYRLVAVGDTVRSFGAAKIVSSEDNWNEKVIDLANKAKAIFVIPYNRPGTVWEIEQIFTRNNWLKKTIFVMLPGSYQWTPFRRKRRQDWVDVSNTVKKSGITLPEYQKIGGLVVYREIGSFDILPMNHCSPNYLLWLCHWIHDANHIVHG